MSQSLGAERTDVHAWRAHLLALAGLVLLALAGFHDAVAAALQVWWVSPTYSHCFLVVPISLWLIWEKREQLAEMTPAVEPRALWALPILLLVWWTGELSTINEVRQFAVVGILQIAILSMLGWRVYRVIWFAALYLFFLVPTGEYLIAPMQRFATYFVDASLNLIGLPHYTEGTIIELTNGRFEIAEACAGLRFLIATVTLGVLFAYMMFRKPYKIILFLLASVIVPLVGNGLRCVGIILLAHYTDNKYGAGADHLVYGWGFNVAILLLLFLIGSFFRDAGADRSDEHGPTGLWRSDSLPKLAIVSFATALLICVGPAVGYWHDSRGVEPDIAELTAPLQLQHWHAGASIGSWRPDFPGADATWARSLFSDELGVSQPVDLFVGYYVRARTAHSLTSHVNNLWSGRDWVALSSGAVQTRLNGQLIGADEWIIGSPSEKRMVWSSYWVDGAFTTSLLKVKLLQAEAALGGHEGEAVLAVSTVIDGTDEAARQRLGAALLALSDLPNRLAATNRRPASSAPSH